MIPIRLELTALHAGQERVLSESARFNVLECGRRFGKSTLGVHLVADTALAGKPAGWFAPTYKLLSESWREIVRELAPITQSRDQQEKRLATITGGSVECWSLDGPDAGRGRKYARVVIDEAGIVRDLEECWQASIRPTLTDYVGEGWFLGTPKGRNFFHRLFVRGESGEEGWRSWRLGTVDNPFISPDEVAAAERELPEHVFRQEYLGIPADDGGNPFGLDAIRACVGPMSAKAPVCWGWDLAKSVDWTVGIAFDADGAVCRMERWQAPWETTIPRIIQMTAGLPALVDSTGVGDPVLERLWKAGSNFEGFKFAATTKQQLMEGLAVAIQQRAITIPDGVVVSELEMFEYEYTRTGVRYSSPAGAHDDCVCALALAVRKKTRTAPVVFLGGGERESKWKVA